MLYTWRSVKVCIKGQAPEPNNGIYLPVSKNIWNACDHSRLSVAEQVLQIYPPTAQTHQSASINGRSDVGHMCRAPSGADAETEIRL